MDKQAIDKARGFFQAKYPDFRSFFEPGVKFHEDEDDYKRQAVETVRNALRPYVDQQEKFASDKQVDELVTSLTDGRVTNFLSWRDVPYLRDKVFVKEGHWLQFMSLMLKCLRESEGPGWKQPLDEMLRWLAELGCAANMTKALPSYFLSLWDPAHHLFIKPSVCNRFLCEIGQQIWEDGERMTFAMYERVLETFSQVRQAIDDWKPRDLIDLQGFYWVAANAIKDSSSQRPPVAYLITWNPENWTWETLQEDVAAVAEGRPVTNEGAQRWSIGNNGRIMKGDRLFLMKQGKAPRGVMGLAVATSDSYEDLHWDPERAKNNDTTHYVDLRFEAVLDPDTSPLLAPASLAGTAAESVDWDTRRSGIQIGSSEATAALEEAWRKHVAEVSRRPPEEPDASGFPDVMRSYMDQRTVFQSTSHGRRYCISSANDRNCVVRRLDANDSSTTITLAGYQQRLMAIRQAGGSQPFEPLDHTVSARMGYLQGPELGLSADQDSILDLSDPDAAAANFCDIIRQLEVDRSSGTPRLYKPALLAVVLDAIRGGDLTDNRIVFDWVLPRFIAKLETLGVSAGAEQAALAFYHLTSDQFWLLSYRDVDQLVDSGTVSPSTVRDRITHARIKEPYWRSIQDRDRLDLAITALSDQWWPGTRVETANYWWVNQGQTYAEEHHRGIVWAPQHNTNGTTMFHWSNVSLIRAGDVIFSYVDGAIRAVSIARTDGYAGTRPTELDGKPWEKEGWTAELEYHELASPVLLSAIQAKIAELNLERGPINVANRVNQGYMFGLSRDAAAIIAGAMDCVSLPAAVRAKMPTSTSRPPKFWAIALGPNGKYWDECYRDGMAVVGGDFMIDFRQYATKADFAKAIGEHRENDADPVNDALMCYQFCYEMQIGDYVIAKMGLDKVLGIGKVTSDYHPAPARSAYKHARDVSWIERKDLLLPEAARLPVKTLTDVTDYESIVAFVKEHFGIDRPPALPPYTIEDALSGVFVPRDEFVATLEALNRKKNVILAGAPGVGKTFVAKRLAYALMRVKDPSRVEMVQFHQSYAYEDFIQGWRPNGDGGFFLKPGVFFEFVEQAKRDTSKPYVFIIDEINRGNLSRIFGELLSLMEHDRRGPEFAVPLTYAKNRSDRFYLPENLYLIGMMNTADRSLAMVDYALRRRFSFTTLRPAFDTSTFKAFLLPSVANSVLDKIVTRMGTLNKTIADDKNLGPGFAVGHSFFCPVAGSQDLGEAWYQAVIKSEIAPLVREYWFDDPNRADDLIKGLLA